MLTADDCDDNDPGSTTVATDADCDGVLTADDCNDSDATTYQLGACYDIFCTTFDSVCVSASLGTPYTDCLTEVAAMALGTSSDTSGDTFSCRGYHLYVATLQDPEVHCPHAAADGGGVCSN